jgi:hypothetical protein
MAERVGFEPLNAEPGIALHGLGRARATKHLSAFQLPPDVIGAF